MYGRPGKPSPYLGEVKLAIPVVHPASGVLSQACGITDALSGNHEGTKDTERKQRVAADIRYEFNVPIFWGTNQKDTEPSRARDHRVRYPAYLRVLRAFVMTGQRGGYPTRLA